VKVDLVVRGACSLIPGVPGLSENIRVICIVDRFLEHSRIYYFESRDALFISSADWMPRNFFSRLELAFPVRNPALKQFLIDVLIPTYLADNVKARELTPQGTWKKRPARTDRGPVRSQFIFQELSASGYRGTPLEQQEIDPSISLSDLA
jgi:polyphosphate kinase